MSITITAMSIGGALCIGVMSPGPSFVMVARTAVSSNRAHGVAAALGMGIGGVAFAVAVLFGLHALFTALPWFYVALKVGGGGYLTYLGYRIWKGAKSPLLFSPNDGQEVPRPLAQSFVLGLVTQLSNPKTAIVYGSIFAALLPHDVVWTLYMVLPLVVFSIEAGWYAIVAVALSSTAPRDAYLRYKSWIDRTAGGVMMLLGVRLMATATKI